MEIVKATPGHARGLAKCVRPVDKMEWEIATGQPFLGHLLAGLVIKGSRNYTLLRNYEPLAIFGVHPTQYPGIGRAWFAGTNELMRRVHEAHRHFKDGIALLHQDHEVLIASSWSQNRVHHAWMERMGFEETDPVFFGEALYLNFTRTRE